MSFKIVGAHELWCTDSPGVSLLQMNGDTDVFPLIMKTGVWVQDLLRMSTVLNLPPGNQLVNQYQIKTVGSFLSHVYKNWNQFDCAHDEF